MDASTKKVACRGMTVDFGTESSHISLPYQMPRITQRIDYHIRKLFLDGLILRNNECTIANFPWHSPNPVTGGYLQPLPPSSSNHYTTPSSHDTQANYVLQESPNRRGTPCSVQRPGRAACFQAHQNCSLPAIKTSICLRTIRTRSAGRARQSSNTETSKQTRHPIS